MKSEINYTFAKALRTFLRQDPEVILVGEIRDQETGNIAVEAALTGHLVCSTLHTNSSVETITRLVFLTAWELANRDARIIVDKKTKK